MFPDITIVCGDHEFPTHKIMLLSRKSHFFESALTGNFAEAHSSRIEIKDQDPVVVARMLCWFYVGEIVCRLDIGGPFNFPDDPYTVAFNAQSSGVELWSCKLAVAMYAIASQFGMPGLQEAASEMFARDFGDGLHKNSKIWDDNPDDVEDLIRSVYAATSEVEKDLRDLVVRSLLLARRRDPTFHCKTDKLVRSIPDLAMDVASCFLTREALKPSYAMQYYEHRKGHHPRLVRPCGCKELEFCRKNHQGGEPSTDLHVSI